MYIVLFYEEYEGYDFDSQCKVFHNRANAETYKKQLNKEYAELNGCRVKDLGDYYIVKQIEVAD